MEKDVKTDVGLGKQLKTAALFNPFQLTLEDLLSETVVSVLSK